MPHSDVVLIIDDEPQIRRVIRNALDDLPVYVREASTAYWWPTGVNAQYWRSGD